MERNSTGGNRGKRFFGFTFSPLPLALSLMSSMLLASYSAVQAQQHKKVARIGYLSPRDRASESIRSGAIRLALRELGYMDGQNIAIEYRYADGKPDRLFGLAAELVDLKVDIIVAAGGDLTVGTVKNVTKTIPIVMVGSGIDPVEAGLVESLARPGDNVTGLTNLLVQLGGKRLELLKEAVPKLARVAVLYDLVPNNVLEFKEVQTAARPLRLTVQPWDARDADGFERVFGALSKERPDGLYVLEAPSMILNQKRIADFALKRGLPSM